MVENTKVIFFSAGAASAHVESTSLAELGGMLRSLRVSELEFLVERVFVVAVYELQPLVKCSINPKTDKDTWQQTDTDTGLDIVLHSCTVKKFYRCVVCYKRTHRLTQALSEIIAVLLFSGQKVWQSA